MQARRAGPGAGSRCLLRSPRISARLRSWLFGVHLAGGPSSSGIRHHEYVLARCRHLVMPTDLGTASCSDDRLALFFLDEWTISRRVLRGRPPRLPCSRVSARAGVRLFKDYRGSPPRPRERQCLPEPWISLNQLIPRSVRRKRAGAPNARPIRAWIPREPHDRVAAVGARTASRCRIVPCPCMPSDLAIARISDRQEPLWACAAEGAMLTTQVFGRGRNVGICPSPNPTSLMIYGGSS